MDTSDLQAQVSKLTQDLADKEKSHREQLAMLEFDGALKDAITAVKGRSAKAVRAMLDVDALKASKNRDADIKAALVRRTAVIFLELLKPHRPTPLVPERVRRLQQTQFILDSPG